MSKVNVGKRSTAQEKEALDRLIAAETAAEGREVVEEDGKKYIVTSGVGGLTIKTRVA